MASLSAHLRQTGDHGRLGFHADCPVCREERLFGTLSSGSVVSRRAQAALAAGALAVSLAAPSSVWSQESDSRQEGNVAPQEPSDGSEGDAPGVSETPGFDPGGDTVLPFEVGAPHAAPQGGADDGEGESGTLETEPEVDPDVRLVPPTESEATPSPGDESAVAPVVPVPAPAPGESSPPATGTPEELVAVQTHPRQSRIKKGPGRPGATSEAYKPGRQPAQQPDRSTPDADTSRSTAPLRTAQAVVQASPAVEVSAAAKRHAAAPPPGGDSRFRVVRPGESLWSIARGLLAPDASMARIAREVARLWELNEDRIATGDPDLLKIGTRLRLR